MTIHKNIQDDLRRYTFIEKVKLFKGYVYIYYGDGKYKKLSHRATIKRLIKIIDEIKEEIGYKETKRLRDIKVRKELKKPMIFGNVGEENEN